MSSTLVEKHKDILNNRIKDFIGKDFDVEAIHIDRYISTEINSFRDEIRIYFHDDGLPLKKIPCAIHSTMLID